MDKMNKVVLHKEYSGFVRFFHWVRALSIFALIATGFYIAYPFCSLILAFIKGCIFYKLMCALFMSCLGFYSLAR